MAQNVCHHSPIGKFTIERGKNCTPPLSQNISLLLHLLLQSADLFYQCNVPFNLSFPKILKVLLKLMISPPSAAFGTTKSMH